MAEGPVYLEDNLFHERFPVIAKFLGIYLSRERFHVNSPDWMSHWCLPSESPYQDVTQRDLLAYKAGLGGWRAPGVFIGDPSLSVTWLHSGTCAPPALKSSSWRAKVMMSWCRVRRPG
jgi:hypothetical protein